MAHTPFDKLTLEEQASLIRNTVLKSRELQLAQLLWIDNVPTTEIAKKLNYAVSTINNDKSRIKKKLNKALLQRVDKCAKNGSNK